MRASRSSGSVEGVVSNHDPYSDCGTTFSANPTPVQEAIALVPSLAES